MLALLDGLEERQTTNCGSTGQLCCSTEPRCNDGLHCQANNKCDVTDTTEEQSDQCTDSDGGKNYYVKGTTRGLSEFGNPLTGNDQCFTETSGEYIAGVTLLERYCGDGEIVMNDYYNCSEGCENGACKGTPPDTETQTGQQTASAYTCANPPTFGAECERGAANVGWNKGCCELSSGKKVIYTCSKTSEYSSQKKDFIYKWSMWTPTAAECQPSATTADTAQTPETESEAVTCVFQGSSESENCGSYIGNTANTAESCSGVSACTISRVSGQRGSQINIRSSCSTQTERITLNGTNETVKFDCSGSTEETNTGTAALMGYCIVGSTDPSSKCSGELKCQQIYDLTNGLSATKGFCCENTDECAYEDKGAKKCIKAMEISVAGSGLRYKCHNGRWQQTGTCADCGKGTWNACDKYECEHLGTTPGNCRWEGGLFNKCVTAG